MIAVVDLDGTLIKENAGVAFVLRVLYYGLGGGVSRSFYFRALRYFFVLPLYIFRWLRPVYSFLQRVSTRLFFDLERSWTEDMVEKALRSTLKRVKIPETSRAFIKRLKARGYRVIILSSSPQVVVDALLPRLGADEGYGISSRWGLVFDAEGKARFLRDFLHLQRVDLVVGNPGREPFWMGNKSIVVRSPKELNAWTSKV